MIKVSSIFSVMCWKNKIIKCDTAQFKKNFKVSGTKSTMISNRSKTVHLIN